MKTLNDWLCDVTISPEASITVGQTFTITCEGSTKLNPQDEILIFPDQENNQYDLVVLDKQIQNENKVFIKATSWKTGDHNYSDYTLVVGGNIIEVKGPKFKVKSVLESETQMNLPSGPYVPQLPLVAQAAIVVAVLLAFVGVFLWFHLNKKYDHALLKMHAFKTSLTPYNELNKQMRAFDLELSQLEDFSAGSHLIYGWTQRLDQILMTYLSLTINEPLFYYTSAQKRRRVIQKFLKKKRMPQNLSDQYLDLQKEIVALMHAARTHSASAGDLIRDLSSTMTMTREFTDALQNQLESRNA